jgi:TolA-binding protein
MELQDTLGNPDGVVKAADRLLERFPDSRYVPEAFLAKSRVLFEKGDKDKARKALEDLQKLVQEKGLSDRWRLECRLGLVLTDSALQGEERAKTLKDIERDANDFPTVKSRARVALAESLLQAGKVDEAESAFRELAAEGRADDAGLAAIYTGLGDCLYTKGANGGNPEALKQAALAYMRVVILYKDHARYASRAMFFAARSLDLQKGDQNLAAARKLYAAVVRDFGNSSYASDARSYLR